MIDKLLEKRVIYSLLARLLKLRVIVLPNYKLIFTINKNYIDEKEFRKQVHQIVKESENALFIDSLGVRYNGDIVNYSFSGLKVN